MTTHFTPALFTFLRDLRRHNNRAWFADNKVRYVADVEAPMLQFIADVGKRLPSVSKAFIADPKRSGGSMYRIYRDTRFSSDKSPYKTWVAASFRHRATADDIAAPGFYLHLAPGECFSGGGIYHPDMPTLTRIRQYIVDKPKAWDAVLRSGVEIEGDSLTRAPAGFGPAHRFIVDLRRKDFYGGDELTERQVVAPDFADTYIETCHRVEPLMRFLTAALGLRW